MELTDITGHEQEGTRPAIIMAVTEGVKIAVIIPLTKNLDAA